MHQKPHDRQPSPEHSDTDSDTSSYAQPQGAPEPRNPPHRRYERMPHERDESAEATGDRLKEDPVPSDRQISDAQKDVEAGRVDTDRRGVPSDVPTATPTSGE